MIKSETRKLSIRIINKLIVSQYLIISFSSIQANLAGALHTGIVSSEIGVNS